MKPKLFLIKLQALLKEVKVKISEAKLRRKHQ